MAWIRTGTAPLSSCLRGAPTLSHLTASGLQRPVRYLTFYSSRGPHPFSKPPSADVSNIELPAEINQTVLNDKRFYAYGSTPTASGNTTAADDEARQNVWTVVTIFGHLSSSGTRESTNVGVQCIRAINGTTDNVTSGASRPLSNLATWATNYKTSTLGAVLLAGWLAM